MRRWRWLSSSSVCAGAVVLCLSVRGQDLAPRAYIITPLHSNAITISYEYHHGDLAFNGTVPIVDGRAQISVPVISWFHSMNILGRTANFTAAFPYGAGTFYGTVLGSETDAYRSGGFDSVYRASINLWGGPSMDIQQFQKWTQKTLVGVSLKVVAPTGQFDSTKLINLGSNRWTFKPEIGFSRRRGRWVVDAYGGAYLYTTNPKFFSQNQYTPGITAQTQAPIGSFEGHLSYDVHPRFWASLDGNFWFGGKTSLNGVENPSTEQRNSRIGATISMPVSRHNSVKFSYSNGAYVKYGGDFNNISVAWQYSWFGRPK